MKALRDDAFSRRPAGSRGRGRRGQGVVAFTLALFCLALLVLSRIDNPMLHAARQTVADLVSPLLVHATSALAPVRALRDRIEAWTAPADEVERLRAENQRLAIWEARARELERRVEDLQALARVVKEQPIAHVSARVVADAGGPFARSVLLNAGKEHGLRGGFPVISADGVIGRVLETGPQSARVLLLTDLNSRVPVLVGDGDVMAILIGDNSPQPRLAHVPATVPLKTGDAVVTSGVGGLFPRGLRVGRVTETPVGLAVQLHARLDRLDHVSVLFHQSPALELVRDDPRPPTSGRRAAVPVPPPGEQAPATRNR